MIQDFHGKTAVLTGAGSGFGLECARIGAARGMNLVLVDVQADALERARVELQAAGAQVLAVRLDVGNEAQMQSLAETVKERFGAPHFVFNNAGVGASGLIWEHTVADWNWVLNVNLWGVIHGVRLFTPMMLEAAAKDPSWRGHIVNTSSMAGLLTAPNLGVYNTTKAAVVSLTETLYQDLRLVTEQVGVSVLCPYFVPTGIGKSDRNRPDAEQAASHLTPSQRIGRAMSEKGVSSGKVSAQEVAQMVFDAMEADRFYIFSHPNGLGNVKSRMDNILAIKNPADPFLDRPEIGAQLKAALRGA